MPRARIEPTELVQRARAGDLRARARLLSLVEERGADGQQVLAALGPSTNHSIVVGFTGPPGVGKSTLVSRLTREARQRGKTVAVLAIDPTSPVTGGAILGDRIRMQEHFGDVGVQVRSMATRGSVGGLSRAATAAIRVLDALEFDFVFVETVGTGQDETDIAAATPTVVVVGVPHLGDDVQAIKAGVLEIADIFVVNKADQPDADRAVSALRFMLSLAHPENGWKPPILKTSATESEGIAPLLDAILAHHEHIVSTGAGKQWLSRRARAELFVSLRDRLLTEFLDRTPVEKIERAVESLASGHLTSDEAVDGLVGR